MSTLQNTPIITVSKNEWTTVTASEMFASTDGTLGTQRTAVKILADEEDLHVQFECLDNPYHSYNTYREHNSDMWNQEVFEVFIAPGSEVPSRYMEIEINPNNALFSAWIDNPDGVSFGVNFVRPEESGIIHQVAVEGESWNGTLKIPFSLIGKSDTYRLNFYRIVLKEEPLSKEWVGDTANSDYLCWSATMSGEQPAFHRPARFGTLKIQA
jgi:hypothetical protein